MKILNRSVRVLRWFDERLEAMVVLGARAVVRAMRDARYALGSPLLVMGLIWVLSPFSLSVVDPGSVGNPAGVEVFSAPERGSRPMRRGQPLTLSSELSIEEDGQVIRYLDQVESADPDALEHLLARCRPELDRCRALTAAAHARWSKGELAGVAVRQGFIENPGVWAGKVRFTLRLLATETLWQSLHGNADAALGTAIASVQLVEMLWDAAGEDRTAITVVMQMQASVLQWIDRPGLFRGGSCTGLARLRALVAHSIPSVDRMRRFLLAQSTEQTSEYAVGMYDRPRVLAIPIPLTESALSVNLRTRERGAAIEQLRELLHERAALAVRGLEGTPDQVRRHLEEVDRRFDAATATPTASRLLARLPLYLLSPAHRSDLIARVLLSGVWGGPVHRQLAPWIAAREHARRI